MDKKLRDNIKHFGSDIKMLDGLPDGELGFLSSVNEVQCQIKQNGSVERPEKISVPVNCTLDFFLERASKILLGTSEVASGRVYHPTVSP